jgi:hypothetical protein
MQNEYNHKLPNDRAVTNEISTYESYNIEEFQMRNLSHEQVIIYGSLVRRYYNIIPLVTTRVIPRMQ